MTLETKKSVYVPDYEKFIIKGRLSLLRPAVLKNAQKKWMDENKSIEHVSRLLDCEPGKTSVIIGTVYTEMAMKPNILRELTAEIELPTQPVFKYPPELDDKYMIEDESGRITLNLKVDKDNKFLLVTGIVIGLLGYEMPSGKFFVEDICFPDLPEQNPLPSTIKEKSKYIALVSGIHFGSQNKSCTLNFDFLLEYLNSFSNGEADLERIIIAGNSISISEKPTETTKSRLGYSTADRNDLMATKALDSLLYEQWVSNDIHVDIMPGETDICNVALPQQPILRSLFYNSKSTLQFTSVSNPYQFEIDGIRVIGTSGQNIDDIFKYVPNSEDRVKMTELTLKARHLAPTAPDTLWCYPYYDSDPFIIEKCPHIYFVGNQPYFATRLIKGKIFVFMFSF